MDGAFRTGLTAVADAIVLGLVCVAGCVLVVTAVPSLAAAYAVIELRRTEPGAPIVSSYAAAFRRQLRRGSLIGLLAAGWWTVVAVDLAYVVAHPTGLLRTIVLALAVLASLAGLAVSVWLPAVLHHGRGGVREVLRVAALLGFGRPGPTMVSLLALAGSALLAFAVPVCAPLALYAVVRLLSRQTPGILRPA